MDLLRDERVLWLRQKVVLTLDIPTETFDSHFGAINVNTTKEDIPAYLIPPAPTAEDIKLHEANKNELKKYLENPHGMGTSIFFACEKWTENIEGK